MKMNNLMLVVKRALFCVVVLGFAVSIGCAPVKPGPEIFTSAEQALAKASAGKAEQHAPVELRFAREKLQEARDAMELREYEVARYLAEHSAVNSELAVAKTQAAQLRRRVAELQQANEVLREDIQATYGEDL